MSKAQQDIRRKTRVLEHAARTGNVRQTCRYFGMPRSLFYVWKGRLCAGGYGRARQQEALRPYASEGDGGAHHRPHLAPAADVSPRTHPHRLVPGTLSRHPGLRRHGVPDPQAPWAEPAPPGSVDVRCTPTATRSRSRAITSRSTWSADLLHAGARARLGAGTGAVPPRPTPTRLPAGC